MQVLSAGPPGTLVLRARRDLPLGPKVPTYNEFKVSILGTVIMALCKCPVRVALGLLGFPQFWIERQFVVCLTLFLTLQDRFMVLTPLFTNSIRNLDSC